jgi:hypothetical protein
MIGSNEFRFNLATIEHIVQHYFDTVLFKPARRRRGFSTLFSGA